MVPSVSENDGTRHRIQPHYASTISADDLTSADICSWRCGANFCYVCGERWKICTCAQWHEDRLYERAAQLADRERDPRRRLYHPPGGNIDPEQELPALLPGAIVPDQIAGFEKGVGLETVPGGAPPPKGEPLEVPDSGPAHNYRRNLDFGIDTDSDEE